MTHDKQKILALTNNQVKKLEDMNEVLQTVNKNIKALQSHEKNIKDCQASYNIKKQTSLESMRIIVDENQLEDMITMDLKIEF